MVYSRIAKNKVLGDDQHFISADNGTGKNQIKQRKMNYSNIMGKRTNQKRKDGTIMKKFTLSTKDGCIRLLAVMLAVILLSSFFAQMISSDGGKIKVETVTFDSRGASTSGELYYPAHANNKDKFPAVIIGHGAGVTSGVMKGFADELARRGFVVLNVDAYGAGRSEFPPYDENEQGLDGYNGRATPGGLLDALNFVRTLSFVDQTRLAMAGHSQGSRRTAYAAMMDCGYLTFNDLMINVLYETFGQEFTEAEIAMDADQLAESRLNADQLAHYNDLRAEKLEYFDTRLKSLCQIGSDATYISPMKAVTVGGHEVMRNCQVNIGIVTGNFDFTYIDYPTREETMKSYHTGTESIQSDVWYVLDDAGNSSTIVGGLYDTEVTKSPELKEAIQNKTTRVITYNPETHSKNFFSIQTNKDVVRFLEQTLSYNCGELDDPATKPIAAGKTVFVWRELLNFVAMLGMVGMLVVLAALLYKTEFFAPCNGPVTEHNPFSQKGYWIINALAVVFGFIAIYYINTIFAPGLPQLPFVPITFAWWLPIVYLAILAGIAIVELVVLHFMNKDKPGYMGIKGLNLKMAPAAIFKTLLISVILLATAYITLVLIEYLFNQDYRMWMAVFAEMKVEYWRYVWRVALFVLIQYLIIGLITNYTIPDTMPEWLDLLIVIVANSLGVWLLAIINIAVLRSSGTLVSNFTSSYGMLVIVPITAYITRKMYKVTNSIWLGAFINSLLVAWHLISSSGLNTFYVQNFFTIFFNI